MSDEYQWHFDYTRLVRDTGFTFQLQRPKSSTAKNLAHIDIDKIILHQDIALVDKNINTVLEHTLDNEQSSVLDQNFVKIFYISQLSVQYLLFCKKYLDNTVAHLKKEVANSKEVINKLHHKIEELQQDATNAKSQVKELQSTLTNTQSIPVFQCNQCPKAFSTEEYLLAHSQRRHENFGHGTSFQVETDKLQSEIKALKERLNNTEKFIHHEDEKLNTKIIVGSAKNNAVENTLLTELQHKFEMLKMHVDNELRMLQTQKFDQGKYEKWFETFLAKLDCYNKDNSSKSVQSDMKAIVNKAEECETCSKKKNEEFSQKDHTTQTELEDVNSQICKNCEKHASPSIKTSPNKVENLTKNENTFEKLEEMFQQRVSGSLEKLENQMQSFCDKMYEFEKQTFSSHRTTPSPTHSADVKVVPKPRKKWNPRPLSAGNPYERNLPPSPSISPKVVESPVLKEKTLKVIEIQPRSKDLDIEEIVSEPKEVKRNIPEITLPKPVSAFDNSDAVVINSTEEKESESTSETYSVESKEVPTTVKSKITVTPKVKQKPTLKNTVAALSIQQVRQKRTIALLNKKLSELGISSDWLTLPTNSYERALNIVVHQSNLAKKTHSNYNHIRDGIVKNIEEEIKKRSHTMPHSRGVSNTSDVKQFRRLKAEQKLKMYTTESETESEITIKERKNLMRNKENTRSQPQRAYFNVIQEFSSKTKTKGDSSDMSLDSDVSVHKDEPKMEQARGVLKNFPSVGSLHKKKVLFNLKSSENVDQNKIETVQMRGEGSTSSIGSSVLDGSKVNLNEHHDKSGSLWGLST